MKRHGNLFHRIVSLPNLWTAHCNARKGKRHYAGVQLVNDEGERLLRELQASLIDKSFTTSPYRTRQVHKPKERTIYILPYYPDRIVQHAVMNVIQPIWDNIFIHDVYSAIPGRGLHAALAHLDEFLEDADRTKYCLQFDIKSFYPSVNHDILMNLIRRKIKCRDTLWLLEDVVRSPGGRTNIPIGNYLSQYFANIYLNWFDHWLKEDKRILYYIRYGDDAVILDYSKRFLHELLDEIERYLQDKLDLRLNPKTQIYPVDARGIDFLGYRTFRHFRLLRKRSADRFKAKVQEIREHHAEMSAQHIVSSIMSYVGWLEHGDCYNLLRKHVLADAQLIQIMNEACGQLEHANPIESKYPEALHA